MDFAGSTRTDENSTTWKRIVANLSVATTTFQGYEIEWNSEIAWSLLSCYAYIGSLLNVSTPTAPNLK